MTLAADALAPPPDLRDWQRRALSAYLERSPRDFTAVATPGAGKTRFALALAARLLAQQVVSAVTVVTPTEHLKTQWADAAARVGIALDPRLGSARGGLARTYQGAVVTYAGVATAPLVHRARTEGRRTLVVLDEVHHAGDALAWGDAVREAFAPATRRLALTGTPFRSDANPIPFVGYAPDGEGGLRSVADSSYGYGEALRDGVVRPVLFLAYSGRMRWRTSAGVELEARLGEPLGPDATAAAWRTALDPAGEWIPAVLRAANERLTVKRREMPDAGGLVIASDQSTARAYAMQLRRITGEDVALVLSDDPGSSRHIATFRHDQRRWMVAVRMVSEGVDVPRLAVGVYATSASTPLFFAQAVGRFVRARRRGETASIFLPSVPALLGHAAELEVTRDHVLGRPADPQGLDDDLLERALRQVDEPGDSDRTTTAVEASASFDRVLYDGAEFGTGAEVGSDDELDFLGLPGLLDADQVATLLRARQAKQASAARRARPAVVAAVPEPEPEPVYEQVAALRRRLSSLVASYAARTGRPHASVHAELRRRCGGPATAQADPDQLQARIEALRRM